ncbi:type II toxin-antitoxin system RelE family toxin [Streptococcus cuniculi]|uniref:Type II toxin-antitoxin system RelE/ParE family toxin n=1 Tax=Streptococcus cuniculi TaxID=1432788 RepID=A0A4Y9JBL3_9STRE|nr:type II toxin-antitoxin system RelE/ParE family toxin [Streptococcus cuniculi]MBF0777943.1 type II toxin-antitoxin system RelE/ParE family toxin [Streptococcus cuniculi]TFU98237.1 type II toxin-antitoxin system RelE/ParE family toxin [Streptococcus cuniculi]
MSYRVKLSPKAQKQLRKLDKGIAGLIVRYLYKHVDGTDNQREKGKGLTANRSGQWRYRIGDYRVICEIIDDDLVVLAITVGHRKDIY